MYWTGAQEKCPSCRKKQIVNAQLELELRVVEIAQGQFAEPRGEVYGQHLRTEQIGGKREKDKEEAWKTVYPRYLKLTGNLL